MSFNKVKISKLSILYLDFETVKEINKFCCIKKGRKSSDKILQGITYVQTKLGVNALIQGKKVASTKYLDGVDLSGRKRHKFMV